MTTPRQIFANLPVTDLPRAKAFYTALGFTVNPQFTNDVAACIVVSDTIYVMLLTNPFFEDFTDRPIADGQASTQMLLALSCADRAEVDRFFEDELPQGDDIVSLIRVAFDHPDERVLRLLRAVRRATPVEAEHQRLPRPAGHRHGPLHRHLTHHPPRRAETHAVLRPI